MHALLLSVPKIPSYGVLLLLAWTVGWWLARRRSRGCGIPVWHIDWLAPLLLGGAALGARLSGRLMQTLGDGGGNDRLLYGALLAALVVAALSAKIARLPFARLCDAFAFSLPAGIILLRAGCFLGGCCWGDICVVPEQLTVAADPAWTRQVQTFPKLCGADWPLRVTFPAGSPAYLQHRTAGLLAPMASRSLPVHPVQLYEAAAVLVLLGLLVLIDGRLRRWGQLFLLSVLGYSAIRFVLDWFRADLGAWVWGLTVSQWASLGAACACLMLGKMRCLPTKAEYACD
jgi:prolipoprotein diacylglyceryltransferase